MSKFKKTQKELSLDNSEKYLTEVLDDRNYRIELSKNKQFIRYIKTQIDHMPNPDKLGKTIRLYFYLSVYKDGIFSTSKYFDELKNGYSWSELVDYYNKYKSLTNITKYFKNSI